MANKEHLQIIKMGPKKWNRWRKGNSIIPDLTSANLQWADLSEANLRRAKLWDADLSWADLSEADLSEAYLFNAILSQAFLYSANLSGAKLHEADLSAADLSKADLSEVAMGSANLSEANLVGADLDGANLRGADLGWADLSEANLSRANLSGANLSGAKLSGAYLSKANLSEAKLHEVNLIVADLSGAKLSRADLSKANLSEAKLHEANMIGAILSEANLRGADLKGADLRRAILINTRIDGAFLTNCRVFGFSAWGLKGIPEDQSNLLITQDGEPIITVDNLEIAQFIYLLLHSQKIRAAIDTIAKKAVLILGRFNERQKPVLEAIRDELRKCDYLPILFDWDKPASRNLVETVSTLAHLSRFVIADITAAKSIPAELMSIVPVLPSVAVQPVMLSSDYEYALFDHIRSFRSVLDVYLYDSQEMLIANLKTCVINPAEAKAQSLMPEHERAKKE